MKILRIVSWFLAIAIALASWRFIVLDMDVAFANMAHQLAASRTLFLLHIIASPLALILVPFQLTGRFRRRWPQIHQFIGRLYCLAVLVGGVSGFIIGFGAMGGMLTKAGFIILSVIWLATTAYGLQMAGQRRFAEHRVWMIRSAALTFAGVTLRLWLPLQLVAGVPFDTAYAVVAWLCWVPNIFVAQYFLMRTTQPADVQRPAMPQAG